MKRLNLAEELSATTYPGRGIVIGRTPDGKKAAIAYSSWDVQRTAVTESS